MSTSGRRPSGATAASRASASRPTTTLRRIPEPRAVDVRCDDEMLWVDAEDGRRLGVPLAHFPRLADATPAQRARWELVGRGIGIHWPDLDEDVSVARLFGSATD